MRSQVLTEDNFNNKIIYSLFAIGDYKINGAVAQLGARLTGSQKVTGSTPVSSILFRI